ncbi:MAG: hypothetical protein JWO19_470 [Bryobacterales bacterium]|nr:hypothetical protein [Bryobacterales bacterium]
MSHKGWAAGAQKALERRALVLEGGAQKANADWVTSPRREGFFLCDKHLRLCGKWLVRQLAPDSSPIEIESMSEHSEQDRLLHAMAWEAANVHLGTPRSRERILNDLKKRPGKWLRSAVKNMATAIIDDWKAWKKAHR